MWWRVRTTLTDRPGSLARLTAACGDHGLNILALQVLPELRGVVDELVLEAGEEWTATELAGLVTRAGGESVAVSPARPEELVDEPVRWLRAAQRVVELPEQRTAVLEELARSGSSYAEHARLAALRDLVDAATALQPGPGAEAAVDHEVLLDAVVARCGERIVATASLDDAGTVTVLVSPAWRRRGVGSATFVRMAGVARHRGMDEIELVGPVDDEDGRATLGMLDAIGLRGVIRLRNGHVHVRIPLAGVRPVPPARRASPA